MAGSMLDFGEAMTTFKGMFPHLETQTIESVLRSNDGAVEATIDALLKLEELKDEGSHSSSSRVHEPTRLSGISLTELKKTAAFKRWQPPLIGNLPSDFLRSPTYGTSQYGDDDHHELPRQRRSLAGRHSGVLPEFSDINRKLAETEDFLHDVEAATGDTDAEQYLEDEKLALMLQNEEFLKVLSTDPEFLAEYEREHGELPIAIAPSSEFVGAHRAARANESAAEEREELRQKLKSMGKSSRVQFAKLAAKFTKLRNKNKPMYARVNGDYSTTNLLDEDDSSVNAAQDDFSTQGDNRYSHLV